MMGRILFPKNTLRRLFLTLTSEIVRHPLRVAHTLTLPGLLRGTDLIRHREYAFLSDLCRWNGLRAPVRAPGLRGGAAGETPDDEGAANGPGSCGPSPASTCRGAGSAPGSRSRPQSPTVLMAVHIGASDPDLTLSTLHSLSKQSHEPARIQMFCENAADSGTLPGLAPEHSPTGIKTVLSSGDLDQMNASTEFIGFLHAGDRLHPNALGTMLDWGTSNSSPADIIYCDETPPAGDLCGIPYLKPDWSPELLLQRNYVGDFFLIRQTTYLECGGLQSFTPAGLYDLLLRATDSKSTTVHVPELLYTNHHSRRLSSTDTKILLEKHMERKGIPSNIIERPENDCVRVKYRLTTFPRISIVIPTAYIDDTVYACLRSVLKKTTYPCFEIIVVENRPPDPTSNHIDRFPVQRLSCHGPFNYSHSNNYAAAHAGGDYLVFLNDDTEIISPAWLEALLEQARLPGVAAVGAHLLYPDGSTQHGGVFWSQGDGIPRHAFRHLRHSKHSTYGWLGLVRNCSAVTFACAMVPRAVFSRLGGLDEHLQVEYNDIDFCLRACEAGYRIVWTPFARLYHKEQASRKSTKYPDDRSCFNHRWHSRLSRPDPYFNPRFREDSVFFIPLEH